jgi:hypothetical protein
MESKRLLQCSSESYYPWRRIIAVFRGPRVARLFLGTSGEAWREDE